MLAGLSCAAVIQALPAGIGFTSRVLAAGGELPYLNDRRRMEDYCVGLLKTLAGRESALSLFKKCVEVIDDAIVAGNHGVQAVERLKAFTTDLMLRTGARRRVGAARVERERGVVMKFSSILGYGFIESEARSTVVFVHYTGIRGAGYRNLEVGQTVEFTVVDGEKGLIAKDVSVVRRPASASSRAVGPGSGE